MMRIRGQAEVLKRALYLLEKKGYYLRNESIVDYTKYFYYYSRMYVHNELYIYSNGEIQPCGLDKGAKTFVFEKLYNVNRFNFKKIVKSIPNFEKP